MHGVNNFEILKLSAKHTTVI